MGTRAFDVGIVSAGHDAADARLHKITGALQRRGLRVQVFALGDAGDGPDGAEVTTSARGGFSRRALRAAALPWRTDARVVLTLDPDLIPMARLAGILRRTKVVVDIHEDYARLLSDRPWARGVLGAGARFVVWMSTRLSAGAAITSVADNHVPPTQARRRIVVENLPDAALLPVNDRFDDRPRAVYIGDLRESRGLFDMIDAVASAPEWSLDLIGPIASADADRLHRRLGVGDLRDRVRLYGRMPPKAAWERAVGAWAGLVFLHETPAFREAMPTKLYEYLATGLPVLTTRLPRQAALVEQSGAGLVVDDGAAAAEVLHRWAATPGEVEKFRSAAASWSAAQHAAKSPYDELAQAIAELAGARSDG